MTRSTRTLKEKPEKKRPPQGRISKPVLLMSWMTKGLMGQTGSPKGRKDWIGVASGQA